MTFPADDIYLGPATFGRRRGTEGFIWHTTEGADASRASAVATANWQKTNPGSYGFIIFDGGILLTVPYLEASGGVNPFSTAWAPERYPELKQKLSPAAYADPNAYLINVAFSGKTAVFRDQGMPQNMVDTARRLIAWAEDLFGRPMVHTSHAQWQTNRTDPGTRVMQLLDPAPLPDTALEDDVAFSGFRPIINRRVIVRKGATPRTSPAFDRNNYDGNAIRDPNGQPIREPNDRARVAVAWVTGTNLTLADGTVHDADTDWVMTGSDANNNIFYHQSDAIGWETIETVEVSTGITKESWTALQMEAAGALRTEAVHLTAAAKALESKTP